MNKHEDRIFSVLEDQIEELNGEVGGMLSMHSRPSNFALYMWECRKHYEI